MIARGRITAIDPRTSTATITIPYDPSITLRECRDVAVFIPDGRTISPEQRRKAWVLVGEIAAWGGYQSREKEQVNRDLKREFLLTRADALTAKAIRSFSLGDVDMETASMYITFLVDFVVEHNVPTREPLSQLCDEIQAYVYACLIHKRCAVCGKKADLHHVDRIGMGGDRHDMCHIGMACLPLCREHHMEAHQHGDRVLMDKYHLETVEIDEKIARVYRLGKDGKEHGSGS